MPAPVIESVAPSRIAEVAAFVRAQKELAAWKERHPEAARELEDLASVYNPCLVASDKAARARGVSCGPHELQSFVRAFDAQVLFDAVGRQKFASMGGVLVTKDVLSIDKERFEALMAQEKVPAELAERVLTYGPRYRSLKAISLP